VAHVGLLHLGKSGGHLLLSRPSIPDVISQHTRTLCFEIFSFTSNESTFCSIGCVRLKRAVPMLCLSLWKLFELKICTL
jgi:hypothetical protein